MDIIQKSIIDCYIWYIIIEKYSRLKLFNHYAIMGSFYSVILENIIRSEYGKYVIECALKRGRILDQNPKEISANPSLGCGRNFLLPLWENIVSFNCINAQILIYIEGIEKGSFSLGNFGNERKREGFDVSYFLNPRRALYK